MSNGTPNPADTLRAAREFAVGPNEVEFLLVRKQEDGRPHVGKIQIGRTVQNELSTLFTNTLTGIIDNLIEGRTEVRDLDIANTVSGESTIQRVHIDDLPDSELFQVLNSRDDHGTTTYDDSPRPDFQLIRMSEPGGRILIGVQSYNDVRVVDTTNELALWYTNTEYEKFQNDLLVIRPSINAIYFDEWVFIMVPSTFENMFEMREEYERLAEEAISGFENSQIQFSDREQISNWFLGNIHMLRDLYEIYENNLHERFTPGDVEEFIEHYDIESRSSLSYTVENGTIVLDVEDYQDTWKLLKILGAKYAQDDIMDFQWEIDSGQRL